VERSELDQARELALDLVVDQNRVAKVGTAVDDAVADRVGALEGLDRPRLLALDEAQLQARRARVDD
jgi:hypothetical protein